MDKTFTHKLLKIFIMYDCHILINIKIVMFNMKTRRLILIEKIDVSVLFAFKLLNTIHIIFY